jgi:hypothetical protein
LCRLNRSRGGLGFSRGPGSACSCNACNPSPRHAGGADVRVSRLLRRHRRGRDGKLFRMWKLRTVVRKRASSTSRAISCKAILRSLGWAASCARPALMSATAPQVVRGTIGLSRAPTGYRRGTHKYGSRKALFLSMRPVLTGVWQVSGRNKIDTRDVR